MKYKLVLGNRDFRAGMFSWVHMVGEEYAKWERDRSATVRIIYFCDEEDLVAFRLKFGI